MLASISMLPAMPPLVSFAQNLEDVVLWRAFSAQETGFYVDIGAGDPVHESVTKLFWDRGWRGINVEPNVYSHGRLCDHRPGDLNLRLGISDRAATRTFFQSSTHPGASTFQRRVALELPFEDVHLEEVEVEVMPLSRLFENHTPPTIDFLKVDTEGMEAEVVRGGDWKRWRPRVLVLESTVPHRAQESHEVWEPILLENSYIFALFDGVNRFYLREEDRDLLSALKVPANVLDGFVPYSHLRVVEALRSDMEAKDEAYRTAEGYIRHLEEDLKDLERYAKQLETTLAAPLEGSEIRFVAPQASTPQPCPEVCAVIVHHQGIDLLDRCLRSLLKSRDVDLQVVVVANACKEPLPSEPIRDPRVHVIWSNQPLGFSGANNVGSRWAVDHLGAPKVFLFLNNDTEVEPHSVATLGEVLRCEPQCGIVGPCLRILGAEDYLNSLGLNVSEIGESWDEGIGKRLVDYGELPVRREVLAVTGSALMMRREAYEQAEGWTEFYSYYLEDIDLCLKARANGWAVINEPAATVHHAVSATAGKASDFKRLLIWRNQFLLLAVHWPWRLLLRVLPRLLAREIVSYAKRRSVGAHADARLQARAWRGALVNLPGALAKRFGRGDLREWVSFLKPAGSVPVIQLPSVEEPESLRTGDVGSPRGAAGGAELDDQELS